MPKQTKKTKQEVASENIVFKQCKMHHDTGFQETERRTTGRGRIGTISFNEADELFRSWIDEKKWPYDALLFDPRVFTFIFEKTSRLISNKPRGKLIPREGSDVLAAKINNELLNYQWDTANIGGSMIAKYSILDINARKYGSSFALNKWRYETDSHGKVVFDGPDMQVLNNRDVAHDPTAIAIENCRWFQVRQYVTLQDLEMVNDEARSAPTYKNLDQLKQNLNMRSAKDESEVLYGGDTRGTNWLSRNREISGLDSDPYGQDPVYKTIEIVTEYRRDRWITFAPRHGVVLRDIDNPYENNELPIIMLRYYAIDDDMYGLSEIEPVKSLQKAINALISQYVDEINQKLYTPIAVGPGVKQHTLRWGKGARWIMNNPMSDFRIVESNSSAAAHFNNTYSALVAAMMTALGESSLGVSNMQPFQGEKTATEVQALQLQRNARDNYNQIFLSECIKRQLMLWHTMNQKLLFSDPDEQVKIFRIVGKDALKYFKQRELHEMVIDDESIELIHELDKGSLDSVGVPTTIKAEPRPKHPVMMGTDEDAEIVPKLRVDDDGSSALLAVEMADITGQFDFIIDVESMTSNYDERRRDARQAAVSLLSTNPNIHDLLMQQGVKPNFKELFISWLEDIGFNDAERFFEQIPEEEMQQQQMPEGGEMPPEQPGPGGGLEQPQMKRPVGRPSSDSIAQAREASQQGGARDIMGAGFGS